MAEQIIALASFLNERTFPVHEVQFAGAFNRCLRRTGKSESFIVRVLTWKCQQLEVEQER